MMTIRFKDSDKEYEINGYGISQHLVTANFPDEVDMSTVERSNAGFVIKDMSGEEMDFSRFTTPYDTLGEFHGVAYSDDGSVETPENPLVYHFTEEDLANMLAQRKEQMIDESKTLLEAFFAENHFVSEAHGEPGTYSVTSEKQTLMMSQYMTYQIEKAINPNAKLTWNETGKECTEWTEQQFLQLILEIKQYVYPAVSYQQSVEVQIKNCTTQEELDQINIDYSQFLQSNK